MLQAAALGPCASDLSIAQIRIPTQMGPGCHLALLTRTYLLSEVTVLLALELRPEMQALRLFGHSPHWVESCGAKLGP